jgi:hypothetical protein
MTISVSQHNNGPYIVDDGTALHTFVDPAAMRRFVETYQALSSAFPGVVFTLADDATILTWPGPPPDPVAIRAAYLAAQDQQIADAAALRQRVLTVAQSAVGQSIDTLTAAQVRALVAVLLYKNGALDKNGVVQPLGQWT